MNVGITRNRMEVVDRGIVATDGFKRKHYRRAALIVSNRIRADFGLPDADRLLCGFPGDTRYGNPVSLTIGAGTAWLVAWLDKNSIVVDTATESFEYPLADESTVMEFVRLFDAGEYPKLDARNGGLK